MTRRGTVLRAALTAAAVLALDQATKALVRAVTDFVDVPLWPTFNVADMAITFGVLALLYVLEGPPSRGRR